MFFTKKRLFYFVFCATLFIAFVVNEKKSDANSIFDSFVNLKLLNVAAGKDKEKSNFPKENPVNPWFHSKPDQHFTFLIQDILADDAREKEREKQKLEKNYYHLPKVPRETKQKKVIYLTFDDGPSNKTFTLLHLLKKYHAKATFFMLDPAMHEYPSAVKKIVNDGHSVGMHGVTHDIHKIYSSPESFVSEMEQGQQTIQRLTGVKTNLVRPPYGSFPFLKQEYIKASDQANLTIWDWNFDSEDWEYPNSFVKSVEQQINHALNDQSIVLLLHDKPATIQQLPALLQYFEKNNYTISAISNKLNPIQFKKVQAFHMNHTEITRER